MTVYDLLIDFTIASALILVGQFLRAKVKFFQEFFMPASMIAGFLGLLLGKQFLNILPFSGSAGSYAGVLIILIFGVVGLNGFSGSSVGKGSGQRLLGFTMYRFVIYFMQYALGILAALTIIRWVVPGINPGFGILMASGFTGGHGTAAAVGKTLADLGWTEAGDLGMTFATVGILTGIFGGLAFIKIGTKRGWTAYTKDFKFISGDLKTGMIQKGNREPLGEETTSPVSLENLAFHLSLVLLISGGGYMLNAKVLAPYVIKGVPDFTMSFIVGILFFVIFRKSGLYNYVDKRVNSRISGVATDYLVFFGIAMINVRVIIDYALPLLIEILVGFVCVFLTMIPLGCAMNDKSWFERSIFCFGYCTGVFAIGFVLLRIVDPENKSLTVEDVALSPWLNFIEVVSWSLVPTMLVAGQGWTVVAATAAICIGCTVVSIVGRAWWGKKPLAGRGGYGLEET